MTNTTSTSDLRELDQRTSDGLEITLFWSASANHVFIAVKDEHQGASIEIEVDPANARDAFLHPFAYTQTPADFRLAA